MQKQRPAPGYNPEPVSNIISRHKAGAKNRTDMVRQCAVIFGCLAIGELVVYLTGTKLPSSIIGMILLTCLLKFKVIKLEKIQKISDFLVSNIGFFFVPPGIALMLYLDLIQEEFWPILVSAFVSTILVLAVTGWVYQISNKKK